MRCAGKIERGSILIITLVAIGMLSAIVSISMERTRVDHSLAGNVKQSIRASQVADSGLALTARKIADAYIKNGNFNDYLESIQFGSSGGGQYGVIVTDNDDVGDANENGDQDGDESPTTDKDKIFRLVATGAVGNSEQVVEAFFRINENSTDITPPASDGIGALGICADHTDITGGGTIDGRDYAAPPYPCTGAHCRTSPTSNPDAAGLSYNVDTTVNLSGTPGGSPSVNNNAGIDCETWEAFLTAAAVAAPKTLSSAASPFNASSLTSDFGTPAEPKILVVEGPGTVQFNGNLNGSGILIVRNAQVVFNGTFTYSGLILIEDEGGGMDLKGTTNLYGSVMVMSASTSDAQVEIDLSGPKEKMKYSTEGLGYASQALVNAEGGSGASLQLLAWRRLEN